MKIIINADDFGISHEVNTRIINCIRHNTISSTTIMANAPAFQEAIEYALQDPSVSYGVHLNLIQFHPLTDETIFRKYGIVDDCGDFIEGAIFALDNISDELKQAIFQEWDAQISKVKESGIIPSHIDSHQHTHAIYALMDVVTKLMKKHGITKVRRSLVPSIRLMLNVKQEETVHLDKSKAVVKKRQNIILRRLNLIKVIFRTSKWNRCMGKQFLLTNSFYAYRTFYWHSDVLVRRVAGQTIELMVHPGLPAFESESKVLESNGLQNNVPFHLITYNDL